MGFLSGIHALMPPGNNFVWFHSTAIFLRGLFLATVWLPKISFKEFSKYLPVLALTTVIAVFAFSILLPLQIPLMIAAGDFTYFAKFLNTSGGLMMLLAAVKLYTSHRSTKKIEDLFFAAQCLLFGIASSLFYVSHIWDRLWWVWHFMRLIAYGVAMYLVLINVKEMVGKFQKLALYDSLTGLANRSLFIDRLHVALLQLPRKKKNMALSYS